MKQVLKIFKFTILLACSVYIVTFFSANRDDLRLILSIDIWPLMFLYCLSVSYQFIHSYRFKIVLDKCSKSDFHFWDWFKIFMQTRFLNLVFPQSGNVYRGTTLKKNYNLSYTDYISTFTSFLWMDTCFNLIIASSVILLFESKLLIAGVNAGLATATITVTLIALPFLINRISIKVEMKFSKTLWIHSKLNQVLGTTINNLTDIKYISKILTVGIIAFTRTLLFYYILFSCFGVEPSVTILVVFYALFKLSSFIVITPGNIGIQELAFGFLSSQLGIGMSEGILVCAVGRAISTSVIILFGVMFGGIGLLKHRKEYSKSELEQ